MTVAPVLPADTRPLPRLAASSCTATRIEAPGLRRNATAGESAIATTSGASTMLNGSVAASA